MLWEAWATWETKHIDGFNFSDVFTVKEKVGSISEDKYQNTSRVKVILLKAVCWTWITFCSGSVSDIDNSLCMKFEQFWWLQNNKKTQTHDNPIFLEEPCVCELQIRKKHAINYVYVRILTFNFTKILSMFKYLDIFKSFSPLPLLFHYRFIIIIFIVNIIFHCFPLVY